MSDPQDQPCPDPRRTIFQAPLSDNQAREVAQIAELETRRYFDMYLRDVWPVQQRDLRDYVAAVVREHDDDRKAHGSVEHKLNRVLWTILGAAAAGGAGGAGAVKLIAVALGSV